MRNFLIFIAIMSLFSCRIYRETEEMRYVEALRDSVEIHYHHHKKSTGLVVVFQSPSEGPTGAEIKRVFPWKKAKYDLLLLEYPYPEDRMRQKSATTIEGRTQVYVEIIDNLRKQKAYEKLDFYSYDYGVYWAVEVGFNISPDKLWIHNFAANDPYIEWQQIQGHDTLSTDQDWQPLRYEEPEEAFDEIKQNIEAKNPAGTLEFDYLSDRLLLEMHEYQIANKYIKLKYPIHWIIREDYPKISKSALELVEMLLPSMPKNQLLRYRDNDELEKKLKEVLKEKR